MKYQRSVKDMLTIHSLTSVMQWYNWFLNTFFSDFVSWIVTFYPLMLVVTGIMHGADNACCVIGWSDVS